MTFIGPRVLSFEPAERLRSAATGLLVRYRAFVFLLAGAIVGIPPLRATLFDGRERCRS